MAKVTIQFLRAARVITAFLRAARVINPFLRAARVKTVISQVVQVQRIKDTTKSDHSRDQTPRHPVTSQTQMPRLPTSSEAQACHIIKCPEAPASTIIKSPEAIHHHSKPSIIVRSPGIKRHLKMTPSWAPKLLQHVKPRSLGFHHH